MLETLPAFLSSYPVAAPGLFIIIRSLAIIIPPIPGVFIDIAGIAAFGWVKAFILGEAGLMLGAMVSFWIARRFREPVVRRITSLEKITEWEAALGRTKTFWALVLLRLPTNAVFDYLSYAAGLLNIRAARFFLSSLLGNLPGTFLFFFFGGFLFRSGVYYAVSFVIAVILLGLTLSKNSWLASWLMGRAAEISQKSQKVKTP